MHVFFVKNFFNQKTWKNWQDFRWNPSSNFVSIERKDDVDQCDKIGRFFIFLGDKFRWKSSPNISSPFGLLWKNIIFILKLLCYFLATFRRVFIPTSGHTDVTFLSPALLFPPFSLSIHSFIFHWPKYWQIGQAWSVTYVQSCDQFWSNKNIRKRTSTGVIFIKGYGEGEMLSVHILTNF